MNTMKFICPLIVVNSIDVSRKFYEEILGQKVQFYFGENVSFESVFAIHPSTHYSKPIDNKPISKGSNNFELYFEYDNLDELVKRLTDNHIELVHPLREQPWRQQVIRFYDPDFHIIEVGEPMENVCFRLFNEGLEIEQISTLTLLPVEFVNESIKRLTQKSTE